MRLEQKRLAKDLDQQDGKDVFKSILSILDQQDGKDAFEYQPYKIFLYYNYFI